MIVTHNMQQAARVSQRTAFFHLGKLIECDDTEQIFTNPQRGDDPGLHHRPLRLTSSDRHQMATEHTVKSYDEQLNLLTAQDPRDGRPGRAAAARRQSRRSTAATSRSPRA